jgi:hypothetical protein
MKRLIFALMMLWSVTTFGGYTTNGYNFFEGSDVADLTELNDSFSNFYANYRSIYTNADVPLAEALFLWTNNLTGVANIYGTGGVVSNFTDYMIGSTSLLDYIGGAGLTNEINVRGSILELEGESKSGSNTIILTAGNLFTNGMADKFGVPNDTWTLSTNTFGIMLKASADTLNIRDSSDSGYRNIRCLNITVDGTQTVANTENLQVTTNFITLNSGVTSAPSLDAWVQVARGTESNAIVKWDESNDDWLIGTDSNSVSVTNLDSWVSILQTQKLDVTDGSYLLALTNAQWQIATGFTASVASRVLTLGYPTNLSFYSNDVGFATGTPVYAESDPVWGAVSNQVTTNASWGNIAFARSNLSEYVNDADFVDGAATIADL